MNGKRTVSIIFTNDPVNSVYLKILMTPDMSLVMYPVLFINPVCRI